MATAPVIVCGLGEVGHHIVELLVRLGETVVVITDHAREERLQAAARAGVRVILGDARSEARLEEAGIAGAKAVIAATDRDLVNLEVCFDARRLRPDLPVVARLFDQALARQLESELDLRRALGTSALAAPSFVSAALGETMMAGLELGGEAFGVGRREVAGELAECADVGGIARRFGLTTLYREGEGGATALPAPEEPVAPGDRLTLLARRADWERLPPPEEPPPPPPVRRPGRLAALAQRWSDTPPLLRGLLIGIVLLVPLSVALLHWVLDLSLADAVFVTVTNLHGELGLSDAGPELRLFEVLLLILGSVTLATAYSMLTDYVVGSRLRRLTSGQRLPRSGHVVVVGLGHVGYRVVDELLRLGVPVVGVDLDPEGAFLSAVRSRAAVVIGDARLDGTLDRCRIEHARALVAATHDDSVNLGLGLAARNRNPRLRTVIRLAEAGFARKVETALRVDAALSASRMAAPTFVAAALWPDVVQAFLAGDRLLVLRRVPREPGRRRQSAGEPGRSPGMRVLWEGEGEALVALAAPLAR